MKIADNIHLIPNVQANSYHIAESEGLTIIDIGMPFQRKRDSVNLIFNWGVK